MTAFWHPEPLWSGQTVLVLGGGPSLRGADLRALALSHEADTTIAVNSTVKLAPWAEALFFGDTAWYRDNQVLVAATYPGLVFSASQRAAMDCPRVRRVHFRYPDGGVFPPPGHHSVRWGPSSGHKAAALAVACGARRVLLAGMDCRLDDSGRSHCHDDYAHRDATTMRRTWAPAWVGWPEAARAVGCEMSFLPSAEGAIADPAEEAA